MCRVHLCNRKAVPNSNLCDGHYRQLVDRVLTGDSTLRIGHKSRPRPISESEARVMDGNR